MPFLEVLKDGAVVQRRQVDHVRVRKGCVVQINSQQVRIFPGQTAPAGEYQVRLVEAEESGQAAGGSSRKLPGRSHLLPHLEGYEITARIGSGGIGTVWKGVQLSSGRPVAIKFLPGYGVASDRVRRRFERKLTMAARLEHPHIARIYDSGLHQGVYYYAMELVDGQPLDRYVTEHGCKRRQILELMKVVCLAVEHAHQHGLVHRDLKPGNILVDRAGCVHVLDFGLTEALELDAADRRVTISLMGEIADTLAYMSPEHAAGRQEQVDGRGDVYSLGVILYRMLVGQPPHELRGTCYEVLRRIIEQDVRRPRQLRKTIDQELEAILLKALAREPQDRYASAGEFAADILRYQKAEPLSVQPATAMQLLREALRPHRSKLAIAAGAVAIAGMSVIATRMYSTGPAWTAVPPAGAGMPGMVMPAMTFADAARARRTAESAWQPLKGLDRSLGFGTLLDQGETIGRTAEALLEKRAYAEAKAAYEILLARCGEIAFRQQERQSPAERAKQARFEGYLAAAREIMSQEGLQRTAPAPVPQSKSKVAWQALEQVRLALQLYPQDEAALGLHQALENWCDLPSSLTLDCGSDVAMEMVLIRSGAFEMGSAESEPWQGPGDRPQHHVCISKPFYLGRYEVTQGQWQAVMGNNPSYLDDSPQLPVERVSWGDCQEFCRRLSRKAGRQVRLPTEAEWEYACRAGTTTPFHYGNSLSSYQANLDGRMPFGDAPAGVYREATTPVGSFCPNRFGLYDMHGNVWEWCEDWYAKDYYWQSAVVDPAGPPSGYSRVIRGGSWVSGNAAMCRSSYRWCKAPHISDYSIGLRVASEIVAMAESAEDEIAAATRDEPDSEPPAGPAPSMTRTSLRLQPAEPATP